MSTRQFTITAFYLFILVLTSLAALVEVGLADVVTNADLDEPPPVPTFTPSPRSEYEAKDRLSFEDLTELFKEAESGSVEAAMKLATFLPQRKNGSRSRRKRGRQKPGISWGTRLSIKTTTRLRLNVLKSRRMQDLKTLKFIWRLGIWKGWERKRTSKRAKRYCSLSPIPGTQQLSKSWQ